MKVSYIIIITLALTGIHLFNDYAGHTFLSTIITIVVFLVLLVVSIMTRRKYLAYGAVILAVSLLMAFALMRFQSHQRKTDAERILTALDDYKKDHVAYPATLEHLSPGYLEKVPRNWFGFHARSFQYKVRNNGFLFTLEYDRNSGKHWDSGMGAWDSYD